MADVVSRDTGSARPSDRTADAHRRGARQRAQRPPWSCATVEPRSLRPKSEQPDLHAQIQCDVTEWVRVEAHANRRTPRASAAEPSAPRRSPATRQRTRPRRGTAPAPGMRGEGRSTALRRPPARVPDGRNPLVQMISCRRRRSRANDPVHGDNPRIEERSLPTMCATFFILVRPTSRNAKPAYVNMTRRPQRRPRSVFAAIRRSSLLIAPPPPRGEARSCCA